MSFVSLILTILKRMKTKIIVLLAAAEVLLALVSWILSSTTLMAVRSLLSSEGIRWFLGHYSEIVLTPLLIWILLLSMSYGVIAESHIFSPSGNELERIGRKAVVGVSLLFIISIAVLVAAPHAILLSATGNLFPSPFSKALVPIVAFGLLVCGMVYGLIVRSFEGVNDIVNAMLLGVYKGSYLILIYLLLIQLYESIFFVFA